jgi:hypothetical protein
MHKKGLRSICLLGVLGRLNYTVSRRKGIVVFDILYYKRLHIGNCCKIYHFVVYCCKNVSFSVSRLSDGGGLKKSYSISLMVVDRKRVNCNSSLMVVVRRKSKEVFCGCGWKKVNCSSCLIVVVRRNTV